MYVDQSRLPSVADQERGPTFRYGPIVDVDQNDGMDLRGLPKGEDLGTPRCGRGGAGRGTGGWRAVDRRFGLDSRHRIDGVTHRYHREVSVCGHDQRVGPTPSPGRWERRPGKVDRVLRAVLRKGGRGVRLSFAGGRCRLQVGPCRHRFDALALADDKAAFFVIGCAGNPCRKPKAGMNRACDIARITGAAAGVAAGVDLGKGSVLERHQSRHVGSPLLAASLVVID
mmetsp:Transcript_3188/g.8811  ORF Transcript_3188/g.8811 Transcript_3188/m.8811 type:complete len:227 (-) Transcript_3188:304-984(-)